MKFSVYREGEIKLGRRYDGFASRPKPTRVKLVEADSAAHAIELFVAQLPKGGGWDTSTMILRERWHGTIALLWIRRFTSSGVYKGETHFYAHEVDR